MDYIGTELNIQGIYYNKKFGIFILYSNGIYRERQFSFEAVENININSDFWESNLFFTKNDENSTNWGIFQVKNDIISIEKWFGRNIGEPLPIAHIKGEILNDTTLVLTDFKFPPQYKVKSDTFHFYPMLIKPDSINPFIK